LKPSEESRGRFNSLDSGLLLGMSSKKNASLRSNKAPGAPAPHLSEPEPERARSATPTAGMFLRSATPTIGGLLAPPSQTQVDGKQGSIALRAIRSMRSLARMGSWAQMKGTSHPTAQEMAEEMANAESEGEKRKEKKKENDGTLKEKKKSKKGEDEEKKSKKRKKEKGKSEEDGSGTVKKSSMKKAGKDKARTMRISTSSFEVGHLSASPEATKTLGTKKHSILGLGLPSTMRLPRIRGGSTASSVILNAGSGMTQSNLAAAPGAASAFLNPNNQSGTLTAPQPSRLSVETAVQAGRDRAASVASSNGSSLRPVSVTSSNSRLSTGSSVISSGASVRWDEEGLETVREQRRKEREERRLSDDSVATNEKAERRTSKESRRSSEGRRRMPLSSIFPEVQHHHIGTAMLQDVTEESSKVEQEDVVDDQRDDSDGVSMASFNTTSSSMRMRRRSYGPYPILTIEEATSDGHGDLEEETTESEEGKTVPATTPVKRARVRPLSEQLLGKSRPKAIHEDEEGESF
jgi:serine/arginine repetitive matrix protein 2